MKLKSNKLKQDNQPRTTKLKNRLVNPNYKKKKPEFKNTINNEYKKIIGSNYQKNKKLKSKKWRRRKTVEDEEEEDESGSNRRRR